MRKRMGARGSRLIGALLVALAMASCMSDAEKKQQYLAEAEVLREEGEFREALILMRRALKLDPQDAQTNLTIADTYSSLGNPGDAAFFYGEAYRLDPSLTRAALAKATTLYASDPDGAEALIDEVLEREPDNAGAYVRKAELALVRSDPEAALTAAFTAAELDPESVLAHRMVGTVYRAMIREARLRRQPVAPETYTAALAAFERAAGLEDGGWYDRYQMALVYGAWPEHGADAQQAWRDAFEEARAADIQVGMTTVANGAVAYARPRRDDTFLRWGLERQLEVRPDRVDTWIRMADLAESQDQQGDETWEGALQEHGDNPLMHVGYATWLARQGRLDDAAAHLEGLPPGLGQSVDVQAIQVEIYGVKGDGEGARRALARLKRDHPGAPQTRLAQARIDLDDGKVQEAAEALRSLAADTDDADTFRLLARAERRLGDPRAGLAAVNRAIELHPNPDVNLYRQRMQLYGQLGDYEGQLATFQQMRLARLPIGDLEQLQRARALYETGRTRAGRRVLNALLERKHPPPPLGAVMAFARYHGETEPARARKLLEQSHRAEPESDIVVQALVGLDVRAGRDEEALRRIDAFEGRMTYQLRVQRVAILIKRDELDLAEQEAREVHAEYPEQPAVTRILVDVLISREKRDEAVAILEEAHAAGRLSPRQRWLLASLYIGDGRLQDARPLLESALAAEPSLHSALNDLAYVLAETDADLDRALELASAAKASQPDSPAVADTLGWVYYRRGLYEPAIQEFRTAIERTERLGTVPADYHYHLALALQGAGRPDEALEALDRALAIDPDHGPAQEARRRLAAGTGAGAGS